MQPTNGIENPDDVIGSIHQTRRQIHEKFHGDIDAMLADARERMKDSGRTILQRGEVEHEAESSTRQLTVDASGNKVATND